MSFESDIYTLMNADPSLNSMVDYIFPKRIKDGIDEQENAILIYAYKRLESQNSRSGMNFLTKWQLGIYVGSRSNTEVIDISRRLIEYLKNYRDDNMNLIIFEDDSPDYDEEEDIHFNDLFFTVIYQ